jgi:hypothetical protein
LSYTRETRRKPPVSLNWNKIVYSFGLPRPPYPFRQCHNPRRLVNVGLPDVRNLMWRPSHHFRDLSVSQVSGCHQLGGEGTPGIMKVFFAPSAGLWVDVHYVQSIPNPADRLRKPIRRQGFSIDANEDRFNSGASMSRFKLGDEGIKFIQP